MRFSKKINRTDQIVIYVSVQELREMFCLSSNAHLGSVASPTGIMVSFIFNQETNNIIPDEEG